MHLDEHQALTLASAAFVNAGVSPEPAQSAAQALTMAEMMGIATHGLMRVRDYCDRIAKGGINPAARPVLVQRAPAVCCVDGQGGLGPATAQAALDAAMQAARKLGMGAAFVKGSSHLGALAPYLWQATQGGYAILATTNTSPMIAPAGGRQALIGNNPIGIGVPNPGGVPVLLDMAISVTARSRVRAAVKAGTAIPDTWATDARGQPTTDPQAAMQGLMQAIGGAKGANLALCLDLLSAGLSGAFLPGTVPDSATLPGQAQGLGHLFILVDTSCLMSPEDLNTRMTTVSETLVASPAVDPQNPVRLPGARAVASLTNARLNGFDLSQSLFDDLTTLAGA